MQPRSAIFLTIGATLAFISQLNISAYNVYHLSAYMHPLMLAKSFLLLLIPAGFAYLGFRYLKFQRWPDPRTSIVLCILSLVYFGFSVYSHLNMDSDSYMPFKRSFLTYLERYLEVLWPLSIFLFWLLLTKGKTRWAAICLLAGTLTAVFDRFFGDVFVLLGNFESVTILGNWGEATKILQFISILYPIALIAASISTLQANATENIHQPLKQVANPELMDILPSSRENPAHPSTGKIPAVVDWLSDFLWSAIPVVGYGFLIWRGSNTKDRFRRNWAISALLWSIIGLAFLFYNLSSELEYFIPRDSIFWVGAVAISVLVLAWLTLLVLIGKDGLEDDNEDEPVPPVLAWIGWSFVAAIPLIGLIYLIVWSASSENNVRKNWAIATLLWTVIAFIFYLQLFAPLLDNISYFITHYL